MTNHSLFAAALALVTLALPGAAHANGWEDDWNAFEDKQFAERAIDWALDNAPAGTKKADIMDELQPPVDVDFCPAGGCIDEGELMESWGLEYFLGLAPDQSIPNWVSNYPLNCDENCYF